MLSSPHSQRPTFAVAQSHKHDVHDILSLLLRGNMSAKVEYLCFSGIGQRLRVHVEREIAENGLSRLKLIHRYNQSS